MRSIGLGLKVQALGPALFAASLAAFVGIAGTPRRGRVGSGG